MTEQIATLGQLLDAAGTTWRAFDIGRHITKLDKNNFLPLKKQKSLTLTRLQVMWLAIQFWDVKASKEPYVWFLKFPLDGKAA